MAWSAKEIRKKKYTPFPGHNDKLSKLYHSEKLPNPNVVRIEVLSPSAKATYLNGGLYAMTNRFQQALMESMLYNDATKPFYGFFDPKDNEGVEFGLTASWEKGKHGFGEFTRKLDTVANMTKEIPVIGKGVGIVSRMANGVGNISSDLVNAAGLNTDSTGACTLKDFKGATFNFDKTVKCKWYMPEQENMARLSISRLLTLAFVRSANMDDKDFVGKLTKAVAELTSSQDYKDTMASVGEFANDAKKGLSQFGSYVSNKAGKVTGAIGGAIRKYFPLGDEMMDYGNDLGEFYSKKAGEAIDAAKNKLTPDADTMKLASDVMKMAANDGLNFMLKINSFFGGNITVNPFPVRLTLGHILDIEPLVIRGVTFHSSKEQFISEDGTHIPLYITADIQFDMWMTPDPKKGFIRWMGDDVFNSGRFLKSAQADKKEGTTGTTGGNKKKGRNKKGR